MIMHLGEQLLHMTGVGLGNSLGSVQAHVSRFARLLN